MEEIKANPFLEMGLKYLDEENYERALEMFGQVVHQEPDSLDALYYRGYTLNRLNHYQQALVDFNHVLAIDSGYVDAYFERATAYSRMGNFPSAVDDLTIVIEINPEYLEAYYNRALANLQAGKPESATGDLSICLEADPENLDLYMLRGRSYLAINVIDRAIVDFCNVLEINPSNVDAYLLRASALDSLGDYTSALNDYLLAVGVDPNSPVCRISLANAYLKKNNEQKARAEFWKALELDPGGASPWQALPVLVALEDDPTVLLEPMINLALGNQASSITFARKGDYLYISIEVLTLRMPLVNLPISAAAAIYKRLAQFCKVDAAASKGSFHYAFQGNKYYMEMERSGGEQDHQVVIRVLYKSFMDRFGFAYKNGPVGFERKANEGKANESVAGKQS